MSHQKDDNDRAMEGERLDPMDDMEEARLPAKEESAKDPEGELEELAPKRSRLYDLADLARDRDRELLSLADLPLGYSLGEPLNGLLGGGLAPGDLIACGASSAGAGKTAFLMQLADGLALRCAKLALYPEGREPLTPVLILSELSPHALTRRSLAWLTQERARVFRAGKTAEKYQGFSWVEEVYQRAKEALTPPAGVFYQMQSWQRQVQAGVLLSRLREEGDSSGTSVVKRVRALTSAWIETLKKSHPGRELWPILIIDPIQRWQEHDQSEVSALNELIEALDITADQEGWIVLCTSDTNKQSARGEVQGDDMEIGAALFRGSYKLLHCADVAFYLDKGEGSQQDPIKYVPLKLFKNRYGPSFGEVYFAWDTPTGRFRPLSEEEQERYTLEKQTAREIKMLEHPVEEEQQPPEESDILMEDTMNYLEDTVNYLYVEKPKGPTGGEYS